MIERRKKEQDKKAEEGADAKQEEDSDAAETPGTATPTSVSSNESPKASASEP
jgi:hypothetical protein